jgi:hypothetical protein
MMKDDRFMLFGYDGLTKHILHNQSISIKSRLSYLLV